VKIHEGVTSGKSVMWFQDWTFMVNDEPDRRHTDDELLALWRREFPSAEGRVSSASFSDGLLVLRAVRAHYNVGRQGHGHRSPAGELIGGAERLSLPYRPNRQRYWYSERWLDGILKERPEFRRQITPLP
jgi:hypothetical protein